MFNLRQLAALAAVCSVSPSYATSSLKPNKDVARDRAPQIFNSVHDSMRQWGSSLHHNGVSFFLATVPEGVLLYHGNNRSESPTEPDWLAYEIEHAEQFARPRGPPPDHDKSRAERRRNSFHLNPVDTETQQHILNTLDKKPQLPESGEKKGGWLHVYKTTRSLPFLYIDGMSGGKTEMGTLDSQDYLLRNQSREEDEPDKPHRGPMGEGSRARELCELSTSWGLQGVIRMEAGFEIIKCDFKVGLEEIQTLQRSGRVSDGPGHPPGYGPGGPGKGPGGPGNDRPDQPDHGEDRPGKHPDGPEGDGPDSPEKRPDGPDGPGGPGKWPGHGPGGPGGDGPNGPGDRPDGPGHWPGHSPDGPGDRPDGPGHWPGHGPGGPDKDRPDGPGHWLGHGPGGPKWPGHGPDGPKHWPGHGPDGPGGPGKWPGHGPGGPEGDGPDGPGDRPEGPGHWPGHGPGGPGKRPEGPGPWPGHPPHHPDDGPEYPPPPPPPHRDETEHPPPPPPPRHWPRDGPRRRHRDGPEYPPPPRGFWPWAGPPPHHPEDGPDHPPPHGPGPWPGHPPNRPEDGHEYPPPRGPKPWPGHPPHRPGERPEYPPPRGPKPWPGHPPRRPGEGPGASPGKRLSRGPGRGPGGGPEGSIVNFEFLRGISNRYDGIGSTRTIVDYSSMVSAFFFPVNLTNPDPKRPDLPRLTNLAKDELNYIKGTVENTIKERLDGKESTINWQDVADLIVKRYSERIQFMAQEGTSPRRISEEANFLLDTFIDYSEEEKSQDNSASIGRCKSLYLQTITPKSSADELLYAAFEEVLSQICTTLFKVRDISLVAQQNEDYALPTAVGSLQSLLNYLGWASFKRCPPCGVDEVCLIPMWPFGTVDAYEHPQCVKSTDGRGSGESYWGDRFGPPPPKYE